MRPTKLSTRYDGKIKPSTPGYAGYLMGSLIIGTVWAFEMITKLPGLLKRKVKRE